MRILTDVDGVLADLVSALCERLEWAGYDYSPQDFKAYDFAKTLCGEALERVNLALAEDSFALSLPLYPGASTFLKELASLGEVVAVTSPHKASRTWAHDRTLWCKTHGIDKVIHTSHKDMVTGDVLIEDHPENARTWQTAHPWGRAILIDRPWNQGTDVGFRRVRSYGEALFAVRSFREAGKAAAMRRASL